MAFGDLGGKLDHFLEVLAGSGEVAAFDSRVAGVKGVIGLMKLFLPISLLAGRRLRPGALR